MSDTVKWNTGKTATALLVTITVCLLLGLGGAIAERSWALAFASCGLWCAGLVTLAVIGMVIDGRR